MKKWEMDVAYFPTMNDEETQIVNMVYTELQKFLRSAPPEVNTQHTLIAMTMMMIGSAALAGLTKDVIAEQFTKIGNAINTGDYDNYIQQTKLLNEQPPTDTKQ